MNETRNYNHNHKATKSQYRLTGDPVFYITVAFFALLTTGLPGVMGQSNFMPIVQALSLTVFTAIPLRRGEVGVALRVVGLWLVVQALMLALIATVLPDQAEQALREGFNYRNLLLRWFYAGDTFPRALVQQPAVGLTELVGVLVGSLATGGLVGGWFLVRAVNLFGFGLGSLLRADPPGLGLLAALVPWRLLILAGYAGFFTLLAQPILTNKWSPAYYWRNQRSLVAGSTLLLLLGLLLGLILPGPWSALVSPYH